VLDLNPRNWGSTTSKRRAEERRSAKLMSACATEYNEVNPFHLSANKKKPTLVVGFFLQPNKQETIGKKLLTNKKRGNFLPLFLF
jgi:hypothetical protein